MIFILWAPHLHTGTIVLCNRLYISKFRLLPIYFRMIKLTQIYNFFFSDYFLQDAVLLDLEAFPWENKAYVFLAYFFISYHVPMPVSIWFLFISFLFPPIFILFLLACHFSSHAGWCEQVSRVQGRRNGGRGHCALNRVLRGHLLGNQDVAVKLKTELISIKF